MLSGSSAEDLFGSASQPISSQENTAPLDLTVDLPVQNSSNSATPKNSADLFAAPPQTQANDNEFGGENDAVEDIYASGPAAEPEKVSALVEWEQNRNKIIADQDDEEEKQISAMRQKASEDLSNFHKKIEEGQETRAHHNVEVDAETKAALESHPENQWEGVVSYIDFNRSDLHEKDVSRMKGLLLQLKH